MRFFMIRIIRLNLTLKSIKNITKFKITRTMSTNDLKRGAEFEQSPDEKRSKIDVNKIMNCSNGTKDQVEDQVVDQIKDEIKDDEKDEIKNDENKNEVKNDPKKVTTTELDINDYRNFRIKEENVGIVEFVSNNRGFKCELKQRFSDFVVHEIASNGKIIELTNQDEPIVDCVEELYEPDEEVLELIPIELREKLEKFDQMDAKADEHVLIKVEDKNKNQRTKIHKFVSRFLSLESTTIETDNQKHIKVIKVNKNKTRKSNNNDWPKSLPVYLHFAFYQENKGTTDGLADLARKLKINVKNIGYAGLKDRRGISTQQCSLFKIYPKRLIDFNKIALKYKSPSFAGNFQFKDLPLFLGDSIGNKFQLVLRDVECENENDINEAVENARSNGYINYFGIQRFGHSEYPSHRIGIELIKKQYKEAINLILRYRQKDLEPAPFARQKKTFNECLKIYKEDNDAKRAFNEFYWKSSNEGCILKGLSIHGTNYFQAFAEIPRNSRFFYCHSFQSFIWNQIASYRFRTYGLKLINGDLVIKKRNLIGGDEKSEANEADESNKDDDKLNEDQLKKKKSDAKEHNEKVKFNYIREFDNDDVVVINDTNIDDYTIYDVVLPLIGPKVQNPENSISDEIKRLLDELGLSEDQVNSVNDLFNVKGSYRRFLCMPVDLKHEIVKYEDNTIRLFQTDLDRLNKIEPKIENIGTKRGIKIEFCLPTCSYATVLIRELSRQNV